MKKNVWIFNHYATGHFYEKGGRHFWISEQLKKKGYNPVVFGASDIHNDKKNINLGNQKYKIIQTEIGVPLVIVKVRSELRGGVQRVLNMIDYYINVQKAAVKYAQKFGRPEVIYASSVHPLTLIAGEKLAKKFHVPCICEVRDLWPETMILMGMWKKNILTSLMYMGEHRIYKKADALVFTMEGATEYIKNQKWDVDSGGDIDLSKVYHVNNGVDLNGFLDNIEKYPIIDEDLLKKDKFVVNYTGSIRAANDVSSLVDVARYLKEMGNNRVKILIWGSGDYVEKLNFLIEKSGLDNIKYKGILKKIFIPSVLTQGDINIYTFRDGGTKYGIDLNKCFEYLASGKPIIGNDDTLFSIVRKYNCGVEKKMNAKQLAETIDYMSNMPEEKYRDLCSNARNAAKDYDFSVLTDKIIRIIEKI